MYKNNNLNNSNDNVLSEKIKKYGNPNRNLIITALIIVFMIIAVVMMFKKKEISKMTTEYAGYYPSCTMLYIDAELTPEKINKINESTNLEIKNLSDLVNRLFDNNKSEKYRLMSEAFGNSFSFGTWNTNQANQTIERSLMIFPVEREGKINHLFEQLSGKEKPINKIFKGYKITSFPNKKIAFLLERNRLFLADSYDTLTFIINGYILKKSNSLYDGENVQKLLHFLDEDKIGTVIINEPSQIMPENIDANKKFKKEIINSRQVLKAFGVTVASLSIKNDLLYLNSYTNYDLFKIKNKNIRETLKIILEEKHDKFRPKILPENIMGYLYLKNPKNYINFALELSGSKIKYEQAKLLLKLFTNLDLDKDVLKLLEKEAVFLAVNTDNSALGYMLILPVSEKMDFVISKLAKLFLMQSPSVKILKNTYKNLNLNTVSLPNFPVVCYGKINQELYAFGEKSAVETFINETFENKSSLLEKDSFKIFDTGMVNDHKLSGYINIQDINKLNNNKKIAYFDKVKNKVETSFFAIGSTDDIIRSSIQLRLKQEK
ncbi:MAG: DUF3352 domain-containing protein [bacterium]